MQAGGGGDDRTLKKRRESNRLCAQRRRARQKRQIEELQEEAFGLTQDNERLRTENLRLRQLVQKELRVSQEMRQRTLSSTLPMVPPRLSFPPTLPMANLPYIFNNPLALDEYISVPRPAFLPNLAAVSAAAGNPNRDLPTLLSTLGLPGTSPFIQRHAVALEDSSAHLNDRAEFPLPTGPPLFASAATASSTKSRKGKSTPKGNPKKRGVKEDSSGGDEDEDSSDTS